MANTNDANGSSPGSFVTPEPLAPLVNGLKRAFDSSDHTDLTIICQGRQWKVHKVVLCAQSEWFKKSCGDRWKEGKGGTITLEEGVAQVIDAMVHWFYEFDYGTSKDIENPLVLDVQVYAAAEKYLLPNLKRLAVTKFEQRAEKAWQSADFANAISEAYHLDNLGLLGRDGVLTQKMTRIVSDHRLEIFDPAKGLETFKIMAVEVAWFGRDVLEASCRTENSKEWAKYNCPKCGACWAIEKKTMGVLLGCPHGCHRDHYVAWWDSYKQA
ncbi:hypothetical protein KC338_g8795 [Hortaea werneckii]|nr:hypothetical protein KC338_g8795 [Hortaea werneckii]KAI6858424.1 hypothetical protein KC323_g6973 [Hortaea werneckii]